MMKTLLQTVYDENIPHIAYDKNAAVDKSFAAGNV